MHQKMLRRETNLKIFYMESNGGRVDIPALQKCLKKNLQDLQQWRLCSRKADIHSYVLMLKLFF